MKQNPTFSSSFCMFLLEVVIVRAMAIITWLVWHKHFFNHIEDNGEGEKELGISIFLSYWTHFKKNLPQDFLLQMKLNPYFLSRL